MALVDKRTQLINDLASIIQSLSDKEYIISVDEAKSKCYDIWDKEYEDVEADFE